MPKYWNGRSGISRPALICRLKNWKYPRSAARLVFEANANRLDLLGPDLASATAYCHASFERAEWQLIATPEDIGGHELDVLHTISAKLEKTAMYLEAFAAGAAPPDCARRPENHLHTTGDRTRLLR